MNKASSTRLFTGAFFLVWVFYFLSFVAGYQLFPVLPLHLRDLGAGLAESGRFSAAFTVGSALGALFTGPLGDRLGQRRVLLIATAFCALFLLIYAVLPLRWAFYLLAPVHGVVWSAIRTSTLALVGGLLPPNRKTEGLSFFGLASPSGVALGPLIGLALFPVIGFQALNLGMAGLFLLLLLWLRRLEPISHLSNGALTFFAWPDSRVLPLAGILCLLAISYGPMPPYSAQEAKALGMMWPSIFLASFSIGMVGLRSVVGFFGMGPNQSRAMLGMLGVCLLGLLILSVAPGGTVRHFLGALSYGAGFGMVHTLCFLAAFERTAPERRGTTVGWLYFAYDSGQALGAFLLGFLMQHWNFRWGWAGGAFLLLFAFPLLGWDRFWKRR